ncbi:MAG TPA: preprotein translocase subunit SecG [Pirellulaceae bacterium]|jgi:preprotein translocase subunit SecG|nr:preprotein translocase subunit SecG [Pirellulaceae bacterium]
MATFLQLLLGGALIVTSTFLILLVLVQRGRGGGLAGALGGMGGSSALGTKAGDTFTRITIGAVVLWIILCCVTMLLLRRAPDQFGTSPVTGEVETELVVPTGDARPAAEAGSGVGAATDPDRSDAGDEALEGDRLDREGAIGEGAAQTAAPTP